MEASASISQLQDGDVILLRCQVDLPGNRWLDGNTSDGTVRLAPDTSFPLFSGTWWRVHGNDIVQLECLGHLPGGNRWLDGRTTETEENSVGLSPTRDLSGTKWQVYVDGQDNPEGALYIRLQCQGDEEGNRWLDGRTQITGESTAPVRLASTFDGLTGSHWVAIQAVTVSAPPVDRAIRVVRTERVGQLTGSQDPEGWTLLNGDTALWGVPGTDLGANTKHSDGKLYIFFGDIGDLDGKGHKFIASSNSKEVIQRRTVALADGIQTVGGGLHLNPITTDLQVEGDLGSLLRTQTPTGAFSYDGRVYVFVLKGAGCHLISTSDPSGPGAYQYEFLFNPYDRPDGSPTRRGFHNVAPCKVRNADHPGLPSPEGDGLILFGQGFNTRSHTDAIHLAWMPLQRGRYNPVLLQPMQGGPGREQTLYYTGRPDNPWSSDADDSVALFWLRRQGAWVSSAWLSEPQVWVVLYSTSNDKDAWEAPIMARIGTSLWDWSAEIELFDPHREGAYGKYMHWPGDPIRQDVLPVVTKDDQPGHAYGAYLLDGFAKWDKTTRELDLYYLLSLWYPYQVQVMRSTLRLPETLKHWRRVTIPILSR